MGKSSALLDFAGIGPALAIVSMGWAADKPKAFDYHSVSGRPGNGEPTSRLEGESAFELKGTSRVQGMKNFGPHWSGDAHLLWHGIVGGKMQTSFSIPKDGEYALSLVLTLAPDYGIFTIRMNGKIVRENFDFYAPRVELAKPFESRKISTRARSANHVIRADRGKPQRPQVQREWLFNGLGLS